MKKLDTSLAIGGLAEAEPSVVALSSVGGTVSRLDDVIARRLLNAHAIARQRRLRISGITVAAGMTLVLLGLVLLFGPLTADEASAVGILCMTLGFLCFGYAMLPTDRRFIRAATYFGNVIMVAVTYYASMSIFGLNGLISNPEPCRNSTATMGYCVAQNAQFWWDGLIYFTSVLAFLWCNRVVRDLKSGRLRHATYPRVALARLWLIAGCLGLGSGMGWTLSAIGRSAFGTNEPNLRNTFTTNQLLRQLLTGANFLIFAVGCLPMSRRFVQRLLAGLGVEAAEASAAASVSAVIGDARDVPAALEAATRVFRSIAFDALTESD